MGGSYRGSGGRREGGREEDVCIEGVRDGAKKGRRPGRNTGTLSTRKWPLEN